MKAVARHSWVSVLVVGVVLFEAVRHVITRTGNPNLFPALILLGAATVPAAFVAFVYQRPLAYDIGATTVTVVALVGGVIGVVTAGSLEYDTLRRLGVLPTVGVGLIEEAAKLVAPLAVLLLLRYRRPSDGLLLGVASGAGFAALETMGYGFVVLITSHGSLAAVDGTLVVRGLLSPAAHMTWTGLTASALWQAANRRWHPAAVGQFVLVFLLAVALHATWDGVGTTTAYIVVAAVSLTLLTVTAHRLHTGANALIQADSTRQQDLGVPR